MVIKLKPGIAFFLTAMLMANLTACGQKENTNAVGTEKPCRESGTVRYCYSWFSLYFLIFPFLIFDPPYKAAY